MLAPAIMLECACGRRPHPLSSGPAVSSGAFLLAPRTPHGALFQIGCYLPERIANSPLLLHQLFRIQQVR
jgi:hypothetical protein